MREKFGENVKNQFGKIKFGKNIKIFGKESLTICQNSPNFCPIDIFYVLLTLISADIIIISTSGMFDS